MDVLVFDLKGSLGHFRRPDTTATHASYPFITRTALHGLLGSMLGLDEFLEEDAWIGIQLLRPVRTSAQEMSLLGKGFLGSGKDFNRPTSVELVVEPHYRIYYTGAYFDRLAELLRNGQSVYHTYLGSAFALTVPAWVGIERGEQLDVGEGDTLEVSTVLPSHVVKELVLANGVQYGRAGGMLYRHIGGRRFRGTLNLVYEVNAQAIAFRALAPPYSPPVKFLRLNGGKVVCLW